MKSMNKLIERYINLLGKARKRNDVLWHFDISSSEMIAMVCV
jgi:hypothetical protein